MPAWEGRVREGVKTYRVLGGVCCAGSHGNRCSSGMISLHLAGQFLHSISVDVEQADAVFRRELRPEVLGHLEALRS